MKKYLTIFSLLLVTEIAIALFLTGNFIRNVVGDILVIPLLYCLVRIVTKFTIFKAIIMVVTIAFGIEFLQLVYSTEILQIENKLITTILGSTFDYKDLLAYVFGAVLIIIFENFRNYANN